jgi:K+-sensing histidine kinase KdpD
MFHELGEVENLIEPLLRPSRKQHYVHLGELVEAEEIEPVEEVEENEDDEGNISIKSGDSLNVPFVADP